MQAVLVTEGRMELFKKLKLGMLLSNRITDNKKTDTTGWKQTPQLASLLWHDMTFRKPFPIIMGHRQHTN